ncbi:hypothetical protein D9M72_600170 [compost metagenome]
MFDRAGFLKKLRRGADQHLEIVELAGDKRGILQSRYADGSVEAFLDEIDEAVVRDDLQRELRMLLAEVDERLADLGIDESARRRDAQPSLQVGVVGAHEIGKVVDLLQDFRGGAVVGMAGFGQRNLARCAM